MYKVKMMSGEKFLITEEEMRGMAGKSGLYPIASIKGLINLSSVSLVIPNKNEPDNLERRILNDGTKAIYKFGQWVLENNQTIKVDLNYYPELLSESKEDLYKLQKDSNIAKKMIENGNINRI